jgi:NAD+ diphosphatase
MNPSSSKSLLCSECGFELFFNPGAAVAGLICSEAGELLVTVRASEPGKGRWDLPGGFIDTNETAEQGLCREIKEELNLDVDTLEYVASAPNKYEYKGVTYLTLDMAFLCRVNDFSNLKPLDDVEQVLFVRPEEIDLTRFAFDSVRSFVKQFMEKVR